MTLRRALALFVFLTAALVFPHSAVAYHFFYVLSPLPLPVAWRTTPVTFVLDVDAPGSNFRTEVQNALNTWNNVTTAVDVFGTPTNSAVDFTGANYGTAWGIPDDGIVEAVCDADASALVRVRVGADTLGYAPTEQRVVGGQGAITDGYFILNCSIPQSANFNYLGTTVHELGHFLGLAHSSAFQDIADRLSPLSINNAPTMYPYAIPNNDVASATLQADDIAAISELYPSGTFAASYGTISGTVTRCGDDTAISGVNVRAVSTSNSINQITRYSGFDRNANGYYEIKVPPGNYNVIIETLVLDPDAMAVLTAVEKDFEQEYRSNAAEEDGCDEEMPDSPTDVAVAAGDLRDEGLLGAAVTSGINIKTNATELAFVVDDTGSMGPEIGAVRTVLTNEIARLVAAGRPFPRTAIVTFRDDVTTLTISRDPAVLQGVVNGLFAGGGGDCPESSNSALLSAGRLLRRGGTSMLFTDADSRPDGPTAGAVSSFYASKSLKLSVLLSGTCDGSGFDARDRGTNASGMDPRNSQNPGYVEAPSDRLPPEPVLGDQSSIETYSSIVGATGGLFAAIPGIKSGDPVEEQRYVNTGTNIAVSASLPTVSLITPGDGPRGTTIDLQITGANTNFQASSVLSFSGDGITVNSRFITSATTMSANITITGNAALGFRDVTVTTALGGGLTETATGVGAFNITDTPTSPTIISITPSSASRGQTLNLTIKGAGTTFTSASMPLFCEFACFDEFSADPKIVVNSTTLVDTTTLIANITIAADAVIAYRNVAVQTGPELADENGVGPLLITAPPLAIPRLTSASPSAAMRGQTINISVVGADTNFVNGTSVLSFSGDGVTVNSTSATSPTTATANVTFSAGATPGFRDVLVTTGGEVAVLVNGFNILAGAPTAEPATGLIAWSIVGNRVTLRWTPPTFGLVPTDYVLEGGLTPGEVLASIPIGSTTPVFTIDAPTGAFYIRLHTLAGAVRSAASNEIRIFVNAPVAAPSAPANLVGLTNGSALALSWRNTFAGGTATSLVLDVSGGAAGAGLSLPLPLSESFTFPSVPAGTYTFNLRAVNGTASSAQSNAVVLTFPGTCSGPPQPPTNLLVFKVGATIFVMWDPPVGGTAVSNYLVAVSGAFNGGIPTTARMISGTVPPGTYNFAISSQNACGTSSATPVQSVTIP